MTYKNGIKEFLIMAVCYGVPMGVFFGLSNQSLLIGIVTFFICYVGLAIGKKVGTKLAAKAGILGGVILIVIGLEIFITSFM